ncbi:MAG: hypothetical protein FJ218_09185 [Ignavibacteria bacterium]|nr:hypothetical protein [Ignavibacteria bacterium]
MEDEKIKVVGKRKIGKKDLLSLNNLFKLVIVLRKDKPFIPRGVYKFKSFEESQEWTLKMMTRK